MLLVKSWTLFGREKNLLMISSCFPRFIRNWLWKTPFLPFHLFCPWLCERHPEETKGKGSDAEGTVLTPSASPALGTTDISSPFVSWGNHLYLKDEGPDFQKRQHPAGDKGLEGTSQGTKHSLVNSLSQVWHQWKLLCLEHLQNSWCFGVLNTSENMALNYS